ncbi:MAG: hypothetical protein C5B50_03090 [Verrucomicrobia bacterium]|nr:MAG: hypothetical protein C5B50_03090 [Verrucomicrobiota bacterium]
MNYTLICDGPTDANLIPIIDWALTNSGGEHVANGMRADFWRLPAPPSSLEDRVVSAIQLFPCQALFIHRDAEREPPANRIAEIRRALEGASARGTRLPAVAVIPVRMLEAWLLFNEAAIRHAAGNPNGRVPLGLPHAREIEQLPDPKENLKTALRTASELHGRRLKKFSTQDAFWRLTDFLDDFSPLRAHAAFRSFERSLSEAAAANWAPDFYS